VGSTINSNILANSNLYSKRLWGMNQRVRGRVLMKKTRGKISRVSVPLMPGYGKYTLYKRALD
jgi:hypothetical protein